MTLKPLFVLTGSLLLSAVAQAQAQAPTATPSVESNVVYGMYSGLALLMDIHRPDKSNGYGIIFIAGSGWYSPMRYDAAPLNSSRGVIRYAEQFAAAGYTVFAINHRQAPRFHYPAAIEDAQRAVRFIRFHASDYAIAADRIGAWGASSGGHLVELLGTLDGKGDASDSDPVNRRSGKVQTVVALAAASDLMSHFATTQRPGTLTSFMGFAFQDPTQPGSAATRIDDFENRQYREASPITHVSADDAPMLLFHGDQDVVVSIDQSAMMERALQQANVKVSFVKVPGGSTRPKLFIRSDGPTST